MVPLGIGFLEPPVFSPMKKIHAVYVGRGIVETVACVFFGTKGYEKIRAFVAIRAEKNGVRVLEIFLPRTGNLYPLLMFRMGAPQVADGLNQDCPAFSTNRHNKGILASFNLNSYPP